MKKLTSPTTRGLTSPNRFAGSSVLLVAIALAGVTGARANSESELGNLETSLTSELNWLKQEPSGGAILVVEEGDTGKFIQFIGAELIVDLPGQSLEDEEMVRATTVMQKLGVPKEIYPVTGESGETLFQTSFQKELDGDVAEGTRIAATVLREVFGFSPGARIRITRIE